MNKNKCAQVIINMSRFVRYVKEICAKWNLPHNLLLLLESFVQQKHLQREGIFCHILVKVLQIDVINNRLVVNGKTKLLRQSLGKGGLSGTNQTRNTNKHLLGTKRCIRKLHVYRPHIIMNTKDNFGRKHIDHRNSHRTHRALQPWREWIQSLFFQNSNESKIKIKIINEHIAYFLSDYAPIKASSE